MNIFGIFSRTKPVSATVEIDKQLQVQLDSELRNLEGLRYILKMVWLGRGDKFNPERAPLFDWITKNFVKAELAESYIGFKRGLVHFEGQNHEELAFEAVSKLVAAKDKLIVIDNTTDSGLSM